MKVEHRTAYRGGAPRPGAGAVFDPALDAALAAVVEADAGERKAGVAKLEAVLAWALAHPGSQGDAASWDPTLVNLQTVGDGLDHLGGEGTPAVAEFAIEELVVGLGMSTGSVMQLVADTLDLAHRLPLLWARVRAGVVPVWVGRKMAAATSSLPLEAVAWVDAQTASLAGRVAWRHLEAKIAYATATWDPTKTRAAEAQAKDGRHLELDFPTKGGPAGRLGLPGAVAVADLRGRLSTTDAVKFDALVTAKAAELATAGDTDTLDVRRSKALGVIADQLMTGDLDLETCGVHSSTTNTSTARSESTTRQSCLPATLFVHVRAEDLTRHRGGDTGVGMVEGLGPATFHLLAEWLGQSDLKIRPVLDLNRADGVDAHDPPGWMREVVIQRDRHCVFPHCDRPARSCDLDHIDPYVPLDEGGPPGQTSPDNLAPLCRRHHRCKTFTRWRYHRLPSGEYAWTDPHGRTRPAPL